MHPTPQQLKPLLDAVDVATWTWAVRSQTPRGRKVSVDWRKAQTDLAEAWEKFQLATSDEVAVHS